METVVHWTVAGRSGTARLAGPGGVWHFGSRAQRFAHDLCFSHPSISSTALIVRVDEIGTQIESLQSEYGTNVTVADPAGKTRALRNGEARRLVVGRNTVHFGAGAVELHLHIDVPRSPRRSGRTVSLSAAELSKDTGRLVCTIAAVLARRGSVTAPQLCLAVANWRGSPAQPNATKQGELLTAALEHLAHPDLSPRANKMERLLVSIGGLYDDQYLDDVEAVLVARQAALRD